jgi:hypothetical protein
MRKLKRKPLSDAFNRIFLSSFFFPLFSSLLFYCYFSYFFFFKGCGALAMAMDEI